VLKGNPMLQSRAKLLVQLPKCKHHDRSKKGCTQPLHARPHKRGYEEDDDAS